MACLNRVILSVACVLGVCVFVTSQAGAADREAKPGGGLPLRVEEVLHWLPADTQTVIVGIGSFGFPESTPDQESIEWNESTVRSCLLGLSMWFTGDRLKEMGGLQVELAIGGKQRKQFETCQIIILKEAAGEASQVAMQAIRHSASKKIDLQDSPVSVYELKDRFGARSYYAEPKPGILLFATYLERVQEVLKRMDRKDTPRALPKHLSEWQQLNAESRLWAIWHRPGRADSRHKPGRVGVVFYIHPEEEDLAVFRFLTRADDPLSIHTRSGRSLIERVGGDIKEIERGVVEVTIYLEKLGKDSFSRNWFVWYLAGNLGYQIGGH
jgi:hypothetical protein